MPKTRKYATNSLEQPLYIFMNVNLLFIINVSKLGRDTSRSICITLWCWLYPLCPQLSWLQGFDSYVSNNFKSGKAFEWKM